MNFPKAVILDMDGLMIDSERVTFESYQKVMKEEGLELDLEFYQKLLGKTKQKCFDIILDEYGSGLPVADIYRRVHQYINLYYALHGVPVKPGLTELLTFLKDQQIPCIIATSSNRHRVLDILSMSHLEDYFQDMVCGDDISHSKPDPEIFLKACQKAGTAPEQALVLEDSEAGIEAAWRAGIPVICVVDMKTPEKQFEQMTEKTVQSLEEVQDLLQECLKPAQSSSKRSRRLRSVLKKR